MSKSDLFKRFIEHVLGHPPTGKPLFLSGMEVVEALWPLNEVFRPRFWIIQSLPYDAAFEPEADAAIEAFVFAPSKDAWNSFSAGAWRVLLERHKQAMVVAAANEAAGNPLMPIPQGFPESARLGAAMCFLLHQMKLPFPPEDRSGDQLPPPSAAVPPWLH